MRALALLAACLAALAQAADPAKILRLTFQAAETGFDPARISDYYSGTVIEAIFEPLLTYDYLARPAKLVPNTAEAMPAVSADGRTYTLRVRKGIFFAADPAFKGAKRELTALDYAYSLGRFRDPKTRSPYAFLYENIEALQAPERHTLVVRLKHADRNFPHVLAFPLSGAVAREAIETYGDDAASHPVGTGPFRLQRYVR